MASKIEICNDAIRIVGALRISALDGQTEQAILLADAWDTVRDSELEKHPWVFSLARTSLPASATTPAFDYQYAYPVPPDSLRILDVGGFPNRYWTIGRNDSRKSILINGTSGLDLKVRYVQRVTTEGEWPPSFCKALAARLAMEICERITQNDGKMQVAASLYEQAIRVARTTDAIEMPPQVQPEDEWILDRGEGCGWGTGAGYPGWWA